MSDEMIKHRTIIHGNTDPKLIYPDIKVAQDMYILPILGTALYDKLQTALNDGSIPRDGSAPTDAAYLPYKALLDNYILDALQYYTMAELPTSMSYQFWNKGVVRKQGENTDLPSMSELIDISNKYRDRGQWYANRLRVYLIQNAATKFKEYYLPGNGIDTINPDRKGFSIPVYLGDDSDYCNPGGFTREPYKP